MARSWPAVSSSGAGGTGSGPSWGAGPRRCPGSWRRQLLYLHDLDPIADAPIRASTTTGVRYAHDHAGSLVHGDVKRLGRIPDGAAGSSMVAKPVTPPTRAPRSATTTFTPWSTNHSRYVYSEVLADEKGPTAAGFLAGALVHFSSVGITVERLILDNHYSYRLSLDVRNLVTERGITR